MGMPMPPSYADGNEVGKRVVLPSSFTGFPKTLWQSSAISVIPSIFIAFTADPTWMEIQADLHPGETVADRPTRERHKRRRNPHDVSRISCMVNLSFCGKKFLQPPLYISIFVREGLATYMYHRNYSFLTDVTF